MKRISFYSITVVCILCTVSSCHKNRVGTPAPATSFKKLTRIEWGASFGGPINFSYDVNGRLIKVENSSEVVSYDYGLVGKVQIKEVSKFNNSTVNEVTGILDDNGRIISGTNVTINSAFPEQWNFTYDANGYLTKFTNKNASTDETFDYTYANGDAIAMVFSNSGTLQGTENYGFYTDKTSISGIDKFVVGFLYNQGLFGKVNAHLLRSDIAIPNGSTTPTLSRNYAYTTDALGYVQLVTISGNSSGTAAYTYQ